MTTTMKLSEELGKHLLEERSHTGLSQGVKNRTKTSIDALVHQDELTYYIQALLNNNPDIFDIVEALHSEENKEREHAQETMKNHYYDFLETISSLKGSPLYDRMTFQTFIAGFYQK